ncbi:hypothetical protein DXD77_04555 [Collinsella sp. TM09-10AT]|nr:hypothetical protein DXD77_04555 [Collinsella sp. TM09-10AT]
MGLARRFPSFSELSKMLRSKDIEYRDLLEQMPEIDELISKLNKRANKYIHKQGHESFYTKPYEVVPESAKHIREDFTDYFTTTVKVCAIFDLPSILSPYYRAIPNANSDSLIV